MSKSLKNIGIVSSLTMVSRVLGLVRDQVVTAVFGIGPLASAFYAAFTLPNLFRRLLGEGAMTAAFVPTLSEELKARERTGAFALVNQVASWLFVVCGTIVVLAMAAIGFAPSLAVEAAEWGMKPGTIQRWLDASELAVILFPYLVFVCLAAAFSAALQTLQRFVEPALSPIWLNVSMIVLLAGAAYGGWAGTKDEAMLWLCAGALLGGFLQMAVPALALMHEGWRPHFDLRVSAPLRQIGRLMGPTVFGSAIYLINMAVSRLIGLSLNESAVAMLNLATRLMELPIGVFAAAVATVVFPLIAKHAAAGDFGAMAAAYRKGMRLILVINVPAAIGLAVLGTPIVGVLFEHGEFTAADTAAMQPVLIVYALGLPFLAFVSIVLRAFYARKDTKTPVHAALLSFIVNIGLSFALMGSLGTVGLAVAGNLAVVVQAIYLQVRLARAGAEFEFRHVWLDLVKVIFASIVMGLLVLVGSWGWGMVAPGSKWTDGIALVVLIGGGAMTYATLVWLLRIEGRADLTAMIARRRGKTA